MGLSEAIARYVTSLRDKEIASSKHVRWMQVGYNASGEFANKSSSKRETELMSTSKCQRIIHASYYSGVVRYSGSFQR